MKSHPIFEKLRIFAPGPTPVPEEVLAELSKAPLHHRTPEFIKILERVKKNLQLLFQTKEPVYLFAASGTGAMEATIVNLFNPKDEVVVVDGGKFGERWTALSQAYGLSPRVIKVPWGEAVSPDEVARAVASQKHCRAVLLQASETSTAVAHPVREIAAAVRAVSDALIVVDAITALAVSPLPMDEWGLDVVISGSQKALMLPPGLAFLAFSKRAAERRAHATLPRFYFNLDAEDKAAKGGETAWTPAVSLICALDVVLKKFTEVPLDSVFDFYARLAEGTRRGCKAMGLDLFAKSHPSNAVTAVHVPACIRDGKKIISHLRERYGITIAGGQDAYSGKAFRIAHLGFYDELEMLTILAALELTLKKLGARLALGSGVGAASQYFMESESK